MENFNKKYLSPDYDNDQDDEDLDDYDDDDIDEDGEEEAIENFLDNSNKNNSTITMNSGNNSSPQWGSSSSGWGTGLGSNPGSIWNNNNNNNSPWGKNNSNTPWQQKPSFGGWNSNWNSSPNNNNIWSSSGEKKSIDREKRIIFCDILDCLVETYQSNGRPGLLPRGIYDIKFRFDVWDKLSCFNPEKIFAMVPRSLLNSSNEVSWRSLLEYVVCSLSEYLRAPYHVCQVLLQTEIGQPKEDMMLKVLGNLDKRKIIQIGVNSGLFGQNNRDQVAANICGIDYIDLSTFMNSYF